MNPLTSILSPRGEEEEMGRYSLPYEERTKDGKIPSPLLPYGLRSTGSLTRPLCYTVLIILRTSTPLP